MAMLTLAALWPLGLWGDNLQRLWKELDEAMLNDLPKSELQILDKITAEAKAQKAYGHLLKAQLMKAQTSVLLSGDSLKSAVAELEQQYEQAKNSEPVLSMVYAAVLGHLYDHNYRLSRDNPGKAKQYFDVALAQPELLAAERTPTFDPAVVKGRDGAVFNHDMLSVVGYEAERLQLLHDFYEQHGNRQAALATALQMLTDRYRYYHASEFNKSEYAAKLDSLIERYGDLQLAGDVAVRRYRHMDDCDVEPKDLYNYLNYALGRWGGWHGMYELRNELKDLTQPKLSAAMGNLVWRPATERVVRLDDIRNVSQVTVTIQRINWNRLEGGNAPSLHDAKKLKALKKLIVPGSAQTIQRRYTGFAPYEVHDDTVTLAPREPGVYLIEVQTDNKKIDVMRELIHVSDMMVVCQEQPQKTLRYAVVSATTGRPVANAKMKFYYFERYKRPAREETLETNELGERLFTYAKSDDIPDRIIPYTEADKFYPMASLSHNYNYSGEPHDYTRTEIFTDRKIYRPGQTVYVSTIGYRTEKGIQTQTAKEGESVVISLFDANGELVNNLTATTNEFGVAQAQFKLPERGLNGSFRVEADWSRRSYAFIQVEEYKRPTFQVEFPKVNEKYQPGDTVVVKGTARSYAGVPVQGAKVTYEVKRSYSWWWRSDGSSGTTLKTGEAVTDANGQFEVEMLMLVPEDDIRYKRSAFYNIVASAKVVDVAGETHEASIALPIGTRPTHFSLDMPSKSETEKLPPVVFGLKNGSGIEIDGKVSYTIDGKDMGTAKTNVPFPLPLDAQQRASGQHKLVAICEGDTIEHEFVLFSLADKKPCVETHDWFYVTHESFPADGSPVTVQVGASDPDTHILYSIMAQDRLLESGCIDLSNALNTREFSYKSEYGSGLRITYAWVKNSKLYSHSATIERPLPDKRLMVTWDTFRDRLTPGQKEEWTAHIAYPDGTPAKAHLIATLYDKSLDQILGNRWNLNIELTQNLPYARWDGSSFGSILVRESAEYKQSEGYGFERSQFDSDLLTLNVWDIENIRFNRSPGAGKERIMVRGRRALGAAPMAMASENMVMRAKDVVAEEVADYDSAPDAEQKSADKPASKSNEQVRENLNETAAFFHSLIADQNGNVAMKFTLPESVTTWRFIGVAHDQQMNHGLLEGEAVAKKTVMVQPNIPRFVRTGDEARIVARLVNTSERAVSGQARLELVNPETNRVEFSQVKKFNAAAASTVPVEFSYLPSGDATLYVCRIIASGKGFSDGEQHYLPVLPNYELVTNTYPITQNDPGTVSVDLKKLFAVNDKTNKLTVEYTNNPAWLMVQALPLMSSAKDENVISQASALYANRLGSYILSQSEAMKETIEVWSKEEGNETTLMSSLNKNQELKNILIDETPWVMDAKREAEQKQQLINFFDDGALNAKMDANIQQLQKLQKSDGSWSWWPDMMGSHYLTLAVAEMLVRLQVMTGNDSRAQAMLSRAYSYLDAMAVKEMNEVKDYDKKNKTDLRPSENIIRYLYIIGLGGHQLSGKVSEAKDYFLKKMEKQTAAYSIYGKATAAVVFAKHKMTDKAKLYLESMRQYSVYNEEKGRYYDTRKAGYSWFDYRIPTQVAVIEALQSIEPDDVKTIYELQRWLLQSKRTQAWDTPINSVNAVYAFLNGRTSILKEQAPAVLSLNGKPLEMPKGTAGLGYVKTSVTGSNMNTFSVKKTAPGISWGALYAQFRQRTKHVDTSSAGMTVKREVVAVNQQSVLTAEQQKNTGTTQPPLSLKVGDKVKIRITITADRDYDFVQVLDKRAACLEPINQLSGYHWGYYCSPKDYSTNYYFDRLSKGEHVVETEYYVDRAGKYETGVCTAQCAYSPEFTARDASLTFDVKE